MTGLEPEKSFEVHIWLHSGEISRELFSFQDDYFRISLARVQDKQVDITEIKIS